MKIYEAFEVIKRCPYIFTEEDIDFDVNSLIEIDDGIYAHKMTIAMFYIIYWNVKPQKCLFHNALIQDDYHRTLAKYWIEYFKELPPKELLYDPSIDAGEWSFIYYWTKYVKTMPPKILWYEYPYGETRGIDLAECIINDLHILPPKELLYDPSMQDRYGRTCAMEWITACKSMPPKELLHDPSIQDNYGHTCAMEWITACKSMPPKELLHEPSIKTTRGETCLMRYINLCMYNYDSANETMITNFPKELLHDPSMQDYEGNTCLMLWLRKLPIKNGYYRSILYNNELTLKDITIPKELLHDPSIQDNKGETCMMKFIISNSINYKIPKELLHDPSIQDNKGYTCAMHWVIHNKRPIPNEFIYNSIIRNNDGKTYKDMIMYRINQLKLIAIDE